MNGPTVLIIALFLLNIGLSIKNELDLREIERARRKRASLQPSIPTSPPNPPMKDHSHWQKEINACIRKILPSQ